MADFNVEDLVGTVKSGAEKLAKDVAGKTESCVGQMKLQYAIKSLKSKIDEAYVDLGSYIYEEFSDEEIEGPVKDKCNHIRELYEELSALNDELASLKDTVLCGACGHYNQSNSSFCSVCGASLKE